MHIVVVDIAELMAIVAEPTVVVMATVVHIIMVADILELTVADFIVVTILVITVTTVPVYALSLGGGTRISVYTKVYYQSVIIQSTGIQTHIITMVGPFTGRTMADMK